MSSSVKLPLSDWGTVYLVATPIGNLEDLSPRAMRVLKEVSLVAAEDTRRSRELMAAFDIHTPMVSLHQHNERSKIPSLLERLEKGESIAVVSDAGFPTISDPGMPFVDEILKAGGKVVPVPGPSAVVAALAASGLPTDRFLFVGFLPTKASKRRKALEALSAEPGSLVLFEGKARILALLSDISLVLGSRLVAVARELTKRHEEILRGTAAEIGQVLSSRDSVLGEFTVVISGSNSEEGAQPLTINQVEGIKALAAEVARVMGVPRKEAYKALLALKNGA